MDSGVLTSILTGPKAAPATSMCTTDTLPRCNLPGGRRVEVADAQPAHNDSALVAHLPDPLEYTITKLPRENTLLEEVIAVLSLASLFGLVWLGPWLGLWFLFQILVKQSHIALMILAFLFFETFLPTGTVWPAFRHARLWDTWRRYFRIRVVTPPLPYLDPSKNYLFAHFPHATFPMGSWLSMPLCDSPETGLPLGTRGAVATVLLKLPLLRHIYAWMGCVPADYHTMQDTLKLASVGVVPEGVAGVFLGASRARERVYVRSRKGYIKLALEAGADIVPIYNLGQSHMLDFYGSCALSRRARAAVGIFWGRWFLPVPRRHEIIITVGRPVKVDKITAPTQEDVARTQERVLDALQALFDQHKHLMPGWQGKMLEVV